MSKPTTTGEWTRDTIKFWDFSQIADAHNAALAAERSKHKPELSQEERFNMGLKDTLAWTERQLADERKKNEMDWQLVVGALDSLGVALADHDHEWTEGERAIYERAVEIAQHEKEHD